MRLASRDEPVGAAVKGMSFEELPRTGVLQFQCISTSGRFLRHERSLPIERVRVEAEFEGLAASGAVHVECGTTPRFMAEVDGRKERSGAGLIGPLSPGRHALRLLPAGQDAPFGEYAAEVQVRPGLAACVCLAHTGCRCASKGVAQKSDTRQVELVIEETGLIGTEAS